MTTTKQMFRPINRLIWGIGAIIIGLLFIVNSDKVLSYAVTLIGVTCLVLGIIRFLVFWFQNRQMQSSRWGMTPISSVILIIIGILLLIRPEFWSTFVMILIGLSMTFMALNQMVLLGRARRAGAQVSFGYYIFPILLLAAGVVTVIDLKILESFLVIFVGCWIVAYGLSELVAYFAMGQYNKRLNQ